MQALLIAPPAAEPVTLAEAKAWLRVDADDEDSAIASLVSAGRVLVEQATRRALVSQSWRVVLDAWPNAGADGGWTLLSTRPAAMPAEVALPLAPVQSVAAIRVYDSLGQPQTLPTASWRLVGAPERARIVFAGAPPQPGATTAGVEIDLVAGYGDPPDTPAPLRHAILALVSYWFDNRGDVASTDTNNLPPRAAALVAPFRRGRLA
ncbi:MAG TPA: head-tail connector protein [Rhodoblastus sp.]|nr:head-tail connector protein [Rhodoblastus sp.]